MDSSNYTINSIKLTDLDNKLKESHARDRYVIVFDNSQANAKTFFTYSATSIDINKMMV